MLKKRYLKPSINTFASSEHLWPLSVAAAKALGVAVGVGVGLLGPKKITTQGDKTLEQ